MKIKKGEYGYRNSKKSMMLTITLVLAAAVLAQLAARMLTGNQAAKNILTVMAILTVLPMANAASPLLASFRYRTPDPAFYKKVSSYELKCRILYDLIVTSKEAVMPMDAIAIHPKGVVAYCSNPKVDGTKAEDFFYQMMAEHKLTLPVKVILEEGVFFRRLDQWKPAEEYQEDLSLPYVEALFKNLSM